MRVKAGCRGRGKRGMETDIYPRPCVTGSAKSAMMNVLAGINPQCTPRLPPCSSSYSYFSSPPPDTLVSTSLTLSPYNSRLSYHPLASHELPHIHELHLYKGYLQTKFHFEFPIIKFAISHKIFFLEKGAFLFTNMQLVLLYFRKVL